MDVVSAFVDETGVLSGSTKDQPVYGIGVLLVHDPDRVTDNFYDLHFGNGSERANRRSQVRETVKGRDGSVTLAELDRLMWSTRHYEYKYSEVSPYNLQSYIDLLNLYFSFDCVEFHAMMVDRTEPGFSLSVWNNDPWQAYVELSRELLVERLSQPAFVVVDFQRRPNSSPISLENTLSLATNVAGCLRASSETQVFLQLVDVLLGCVQADWKDQNGFYAPESGRAQAKRELLKFLKSRLGLPASQPMITHTDRVLEVPEPVPFSVSLKAVSAAMSGALPD